MTLLVVHSRLGKHCFEVANGLSVREALDITTLRVRAACGGTGACGACVIRLVGGEVSAPTVAEYMKLSSDERAAGARLGCQVRLKGDTEIRLDRPAPPSPWKSIPPENLQPITHGLPDLRAHTLGVAIDLGTTQIRVSLLDRRSGRRIATRRGPNPQGVYGADILNRLEAARANSAHAAELAKRVRTAILRAVRDILARDIGEVKTMLAEIGQIFIVGNTAMLALLTGRGADTLLDPAHWQGAIDCRPHDATFWRAKEALPCAELVMPDPVAGFIGSDLVADLLATGLTEGPAGALLLDIGTNTEIALWDGATLHVTSVAGGPAFEGSGIRRGMAAEPGAIDSVCSVDNHYRWRTIGGGAPQGFCGSGLIDAIAVLLADGQLKPSGRFATPPGPDGYPLDPNHPNTAITSSDIDVFQRAKAATAAAMSQLLIQAGMTWKDLRRLCICGAFGRTLRLEHAQAIGLLPAVSPGSIELHAEAALAGCEQALLSSDGARCFDALTSKTKMINLSLLPDYEDRYIEHLRLRPIALTPTTGAKALTEPTR
ncbi:MAG: DUF4445 domain-containing protein [Candidatus Competibacteraceae bacterium]|nr:DUF4445 domain-containing protein [Candidatus Competibacteraceae bacterium]